MRKLLTGLRTEIILYVAVLMMVSTGLIGFVVLKVSGQAALEQKAAGARSILNSIQGGIKSSVEVQRLIDIFMEGGGVDSIVVVDADMKIVADSSHEKIGQPYSDESILKAIKERVSVPVAKAGTLTVSSPLYVGERLFGGAAVTLSTKDVMETAARSQRLIFFYIALNSLILVVFGSLLLSRTIVRPIDELVKVTEAVADGDLTQKIRVGRLNEIGMLSESFNRMTERLRNGKEALEGNIRSLEAAHEELKKAQDEVMRAEKMASVGRLAAGIAHEIGNPISAILGYTNILQHSAVKEDEKDYLRRIESEVQRVNRIVRGLLDYARPGGLKVEAVDVNEVVRSSLDLVSAQKGFERITIETGLEEVPMVMADSHQLQQVLINLLINASDAMPEGGILTVRSGVKGRGGVTTPVQDWVEISVTDTGTGISEEEIKKIFDPFYTTKEPGKGTGLGLAICQRIMESFGGRIEVESRAGEGSRFSVLLPVKEEEL